LNSPKPGLIQNSNYSAVVKTRRDNGQAHRMQTTFATKPITYDVLVQRGC
jgi:hypothetical protein